MLPKNCKFQKEHFIEKLNNTIYNKKNILLLITTAIILNACSIYSFTGAAISADIKTVSINYFDNYSKQVQPTLSQVFTEKIKDVFISQTTLNLTSSIADLQLSGSIINYDISPISISNGSASKNRLTIVIKAIFVNTKNEENNFEKTFSRFADFDSNLSISSVENELIKEIVEQLAQDIFNESIVNW